MRWLGFDWGEHLYFASDYFEQLYEWAVDLIKAGKAYVDDLSADEIREHRGTLTEPGRDSPWRDRPVEENLDLFARMRAGEFPDGARVLRARIDMAVAATSTCATRSCTGSSTPSTRAPATPGASTRPTTSPTGSPTRSRASRTPSARWSSRTTGRSTTGSSTTCRCPSRPHQYEFARLNLTHTVLSKRVLLRLVNEGHVRGWDDPRMPTISGLRRRGFPAEGIRDFAAHDRGGQGRQRRRGRDARARRARRAQPDGAPPLRRPRPPQGRHRELPRGPGRGDGGRQQPGGPVGRDAARCPSRASCGSSATTSWRSRPRSSSAWRRAARCGCAPRTSSPAREVVKDADRRDRRAALHVRPGHARRRRSRRPPPQGDAPLGVGRARRARRGPALRPPLHGARTPAPTAATSSRTSNPDSETVLTRLLRGAVARRRCRSARPCSSSGSATSARIPTRRPGALVFNRTLTLKDTWAKLQAQGRQDTA